MRQPSSEATTFSRRDTSDASNSSAVLPFGRPIGPKTIANIPDMTIFVASGLVAWQAACFGRPGKLGRLGIEKDLKATDVRLQPTSPEHLLRRHHHLRCLASGTSLPS